MFRLIVRSKIRLVNVADVVCLSKVPSKRASAKDRDRDTKSCL
jgi:hypothetical protein